MFVLLSKNELVPDCPAIRVFDYYFINVLTWCQLAEVKDSDKASYIHRWREEAEGYCHDDRLLCTTDESAIYFCLQLCIFFSLKGLTLLRK